jgi:intracellular septation protein
VLNLFVVFVLHVSDSVWVNFKLFGCTGLTLLFVVGQSLWLAKYLKED